MTMHVVPSPVGHTAAQIARITSIMPPPRGVEVEALSKAYFDSLKAFPAEAIKDAVDGFLSGRFGERKWLPLPPELATMVRTCLGVIAPAGGAGRAYAIRAPRSAILKDGCTREWARERVSRGEFPKGSIWFPGAYRDNAAFGDLYAPDPNWKPGTLILTKDEADEKARREAEEQARSGGGGRSFTPAHLRPVPA